MQPFSSLPAELYRACPRPIRLSGAGRGLAAVAIVCGLAAPVTGVLLQRQVITDRAERDALLQTGVVTDGIVVRLSRDSKDSNRATASYRFSANGGTFADRAKLPMARWRALRTGGTLRIRYVPENPAVNIPDGVIPGVMPAVLPFLVPPLLLLPGLFCTLGLRYQRRLLIGGRAALAVITSVTQRRGPHGESIRMVRYEFPLLTGATQTGSVQVTAAAPEVGSSIAVLYDDERPRQNRPYPLSLVRLAEE